MTIGFEKPNIVFIMAEDSFSFPPALPGDLGENISRKMIVHHSGDGMFSIRDGKWKLRLHKVIG